MMWNSTLLASLLSEIAYLIVYLIVTAESGSDRREQISFDVLKNILTNF